MTDQNYLKPSDRPVDLAEQGRELANGLEAAAQQFLRFQRSKVEEWLAALADLFQAKLGPD